MSQLVPLGEEIRPIQNYEGLYAITSYGRVWGYEKIRKRRTFKARFLKLAKDKNGYFRICLYKRGEHKSYRVNRLVAKAFIKNPNNLPVVNHKDTNKQNNNKDNLEWVTIENNNNHAIVNDLLNKKSSKYYGIYFHRKLRGNKKWIARVSVDKNQIRIGSYKTELEAVYAYDNFIYENNLNRPLNFIRRNINVR